MMKDSEKYERKMKILKISMHQQYHTAFGGNYGFLER